MLGAPKERLQAEVRDAVEQGDAKLVATLMRTKVEAHFRQRRGVVAESRNREEGQRLSNGITPEEIVNLFAGIVKPDSPEAFAPSSTSSEPMASFAKMRTAGRRW